MFCLNLPKKTVSMIQVWVSVLLILVSIFLAFSPIITFDLMDEATADSIEEMLGELGGDEIEIPDGKLEVSAPKLIGCINLFTKLIGVAGNENATQAERDELQAMMEGEEGKNSMLIAAALAVSIGDVFAEDGEDAGIIGMILNVLVVLICTIYMLGFTLIIPFVYIIVGIVALIRGLTKMKTPEDVAGKVAKTLPGMIVYPMLLLAFQAVLPGMGFGSGALGLWILAFVATFLNVVVSRLRTYTVADIKYANVLQGVSLLSIVGYLVFFFNIIKTGVFHTFISGDWSTVAAMAMGNGLEATITEHEAAEVVSNGYIVDAVLVMLAVFFVIGSIDYFKDVLQRLSLSKTKGGDNGIASAIITLLACVLPMVVAGSQNNYENIFDLESEPIGSFLDNMTDDGKSALTMALVGAIIVLVSEIALIVLKKVFCADSTAASRLAVLNGLAPAPEAVAEAPVEEAVPAAAVAEETVEEAPVAEEAPAAEEAAEEAPAEEKTEA